MDAYNFIIPTIDKDSEAYKNRHQITVDEYATFKWRGVDSYETFGCLITNKKDLKWVNYAAYKDEFSNPMFSSSISYLGTTYQQKSLKLNLGIYWVTDAEYRLFLNWISPDVVGEFEFGYNKKWAYKVKVGSIGDSTYYTLGYNEKGETVYYVELNITFVTVDNTAVTCTECWYEKTNKRDEEIDIFFVEEKDRRTELYTNINYVHQMKLLPNVNYKVSFCQMPDNKILWSLSELQGIDDEILQNQFLLFSFTTNDFEEQDIYITIQYDSERGNLYINNQLLSDLMLIGGKSIIKSYQVNKFVLPGVLNNTSLAHHIGIDIENFIYGTLEYYDMYGDLVDTIQIWPSNDLTTYSYYSMKKGEQENSYVIPPEGQRWVCNNNSILSKVKALSKTIKEYAIPTDKNSNITELYINLTTIDNPLELYFYAFDENSSISIDWGDGNKDKNLPTSKLQGPFSCSHSYTEIGEYTIKISKNGNIGIGNSSTDTFIANLKNSFISSDCITRIIIGKDFRITQNSLAELKNLKKVVFTNQKEIISECFRGDTNLEFVNFLYPIENKIIRENSFEGITKITELYVLSSTSLDKNSLSNSSISTVLQCNFGAGENLLREIKEPSDTIESGDFLLPFYIRLQIKDNETVSKISEIENNPVISIYPKRQL